MLQDIAEDFLAVNLDPLSSLQRLHLAEVLNLLVLYVEGFKILRVVQVALDGANIHVCTDTFTQATHEGEWEHGNSRVISVFNHVGEPAVL